MNDPGCPQNEVWALICETGYARDPTLCVLCWETIEDESEDEPGVCVACSGEADGAWGNE